MKTRITPKTSEHATTLLVALFLTTILAVTIAGYLKHAYQQHYLSMRSQVWNSSIAISEAGIEEGLQHLNSNSTNLNVNGWTKSGSTYSMTRTLSPGKSYEVSINAANLNNPEITSVAHTTPPSVAKSPVSSMMAAIGVNEGVSENSGVVNRAVRIKASRSGVFIKALVAKHGIRMNGNVGKTDSFDSSDPNHSNDGMYPSGNTSKLLDNGDVASNDSAIGIVDVGNWEIYGRVSVGPGGTVSVGNNGGVGTRAWRAGNSGIQPGYFSDDMNFTFPTVTLPYTTTGLTPSSGNVSTTNFTYSSSSSNITSTTYPNPVPASGVTSNFSYNTVSTLPSPIPYGTVTNTLTTPTTTTNYPAAGTYVGTVVSSVTTTTNTTAVVGATTYPAAGTYVGTVTTREVTSGPKSGRGTFYDYTAITSTATISSYSYNKITGKNYTYPWTTYTYTYATITTNFTVTTASYANILNGSAPGMPPIDYFVNGNLSGSVLVRGNVRLVVKNNASVGDLTIATDGKLEMYVGGSSLSLAGNNTMNANGYAQRLIIWCMDSVTSMSMSGNASFTGCIFAPNANLSLNGGGNNDLDFIGSLVINSITLNGHFNFHYDEALRNMSDYGRYKVTEWNEIPITQLR